MRARLTSLQMWIFQLQSRLPLPLQAFVPCGSRSPVSTPLRLLALALAANYFFFHAELSEEEYLRNNPVPSASPTFMLPALTWETYGKTDATSVLPDAVLEPMHAVESIAGRRCTDPHATDVWQEHEGRAPPHV